MKTRVCDQCRGPMPLMARAHAATCSPRCRQARSRARRAIPVELTSRPRWVRRTAAKVPLTVAGHAADCTDPATWSRHRAAATSTTGVGLGFVLTADDDVLCLDLDHALDASGRPEAWAQRILDAAGPTWVEVSASGEGLHVWGRGRLPGGHGRRLNLNPGSVELYDRGRYIAVTGQTWGDTPPRLGDLQHVIDSLL